MQVRLDDPVDLKEFRRVARGLLAAGTPPHEVVWSEGPTGDLFDSAASETVAGGMALDLFDLPATATTTATQPPARPATATATATATLSAPASASLPATTRTSALTRNAPDGDAQRVPAAFVDLCQRVILHRDPQRLALLYRLLWRLVHQPTLRHDPLDPDMLQAQRMGRAVSRDIHKMRAFVRFTAVQAAPGSVRHVAWFEPEHRIVEANATFFMRRFAQMRWAILTPQRCVEWDGQALTFGPGADVSAKPPPDAGEALWLTYYEHIFNPARLKLAMMKREMPVRYWKNLPEAALIAPLSAAAQERSQNMIDAPATAPRRIRAPQPIHIVPAAGVAPANLDELRAAAHACRACPLGALATQAVCGEGPHAAAHMLVGEQPGDQEDLAGRPFVGPAGQLLDRAMAELGWPRDTVYLANAVKHFKYELRGKRRLHKTAAQLEAQACAPWLAHEIDLVRPRVLVALGATAARTLLGRQVGVQAERGRWLHERADGRPVLVTLHPSALLRMPDDQRRDAYRHWLDDLARAREGAARMRSA